MALDKELVAALEVFRQRNDLKRWHDCCVNLYQQDKVDGLVYVKAFRAEMTKKAQDGDSEAFNWCKKSYLITAKDIFDDYMIYIEWNREPKKKFWLPRRSVLLPVVEDLQRLAEGELTLLGISLPPGCGKTTLAIFYLTWLAGKYPDAPMLTGSHSNSLVRGVYDECLRIFEVNGDYLWHDVFPTVNVTNTNAKDSRIDLGKRKRFETLEFTSIGTGNAGLYRAETLLYCDDLVSGIEVALSKERLDKLWETYTTDLRQRKKGDNCRELHIATRWSVHDVLGRLERQYENDPKAKFIVIPALDDEDNSRFDYMFGVGFTTGFYHEQRDIMDAASWRALYMNEPVEREGLLYHADDLRRFYELPAGEPDAVLAICDTAEGGGDDTFLPVFYQYGNDHYCVDCVCSDALPEITDGLCADILLRHKVKMCQFESNSAGGRTADKVQEIVKSKGGHTHITKKRTTANKATKIIVNSPYTKEHCLFYDNKMIKRGSPYASMMNKMCSYTVSGKSKHDDVVDGMAQYALFVQSLEGNVAVVQRRLF